MKVTFKNTRNVVLFGQLLTGEMFEFEGGLFVRTDEGYSPQSAVIVSKIPSGASVGAGRITPFKRDTVVTRVKAITVELEN